MNMEYLGGISGEGALMQHGKDLGRACYDFDGFFTPHTGITCNGELRCSASMLAAILDRAGLQLQTDDGRLLDLQVSDKTIFPSREAVHVDVRGQLPEEKGDWRRRPDA